MGEVKEKSLNFLGAHLAEVALVVEKNKAARDTASLIENFFAKVVDPRSG